MVGMIVRGTYKIGAGDRVCTTPSPPVAPDQHTPRAQAAYNFAFNAFCPPNSSGFWN